MKELKPIKTVFSYWKKYLISYTKSDKISLYYYPKLRIA